MSSTRLPGKVLKEVNGVPLLAYELARLNHSKMINKLVVATSDEPLDDAIAKLCEKVGVQCFRGSLNDVLSRYIGAADLYPDHDVIVRVTGDCPLIDPVVVDQTINFFLDGKYDYASNVPTNEETFPDGMDCEVFTRKALLEAGGKAMLASEHEHPNAYIRNGKQFTHGGMKGDGNYGGYRLTVDNPEDFEVIKFLIEHSSPDASCVDYVKLLDAHPEVRSLNMYIGHNEGYAKSLKEDKLFIDSDKK